MQIVLRTPESTNGKTEKRLSAKKSRIPLFKFLHEDYGIREEWVFEANAEELFLNAKIAYDNKRKGLLAVSTNEVDNAFNKINTGMMKRRREEMDLESLKAGHYQMTHYIPDGSEDPFPFLKIIDVVNTREFQGQNPPFIIPKGMLPHLADEPLKPIPSVSFLKFVLSTNLAYRLGITAREINMLIDLDLPPRFHKSQILQALLYTSRQADLEEVRLPRGDDLKAN